MTDVVYKELYETKKQLETVENTLSAVVTEVAQITGLDLSTVTLQALLETLRANYVKPAEAEVTEVAAEIDPA
ncbi:hypothetical protein [Yersinia phage vB_YenM_P778]